MPTSLHDTPAGPGEPGNGSAALLDATGLLGSLGASIPLVAAPMAGGPSTPALVLATAEAGGLGFLAGGYKTPVLLAAQIAEVRGGTSRFGVNLFAPNPVPVHPEAFVRYAKALQEVAATYNISLDGVAPLEDDDGWEAKADMLVNDPVPVVSFTFGLPPTDLVRRLRKAGSLVLQTVTSAREAEQAAACGVDALVLQSYQAGGHSGTLTPAVPVQEIPLASLLDRVRSTVQLPIWAAGGVCTSSGVRDAVAHGAEAVVVGTVLLRSPESGASEAYKAALAGADRRGTVLTTAFSGRPARALRNRFVDQFHALAPSGYPAIHHLTSGLRKAAAAAGDSQWINIWAGTGHADAAEEPAADILRRLAVLD